MFYLFTKIALTGLAAAALLVDVGQAFASQKRQTPPAAQKETWEKYGVAFKVPPGWKKTDEHDNRMEWVGPGNLKLWITIGTYKPEFYDAESEVKFGNSSIEDETREFYEDHRKYGEEDLRYLEVDGLKGVHYSRNDETWDQRYHMYKAKLIIWNAQWVHKGQRQVVTVNMFSPVETFAKDRETLYGILQSLTFSR